MQKKNIGIEKAVQKIRQYCSYQERSHVEVKEKLYSFGLYKKEVEVLISQMIEENYLNEERFAIAFAGGRFRIKKWGRVKIRYELKQKRVGEYCIKMALAALDKDAYQKMFDKLAKDKCKTLSSEKNIFIKKQKLRSFLLQKGYEPEVIMEFIHKI